MNTFILDTISIKFSFDRAEWHLPRKIMKLVSWCYIHFILLNSSAKCTKKIEIECIYIYMYIYLCQRHRNSISIGLQAGCYGFKSRSWQIFVLAIQVFVTICVYKHTSRILYTVLKLMLKFNFKLILNLNKSISF